MNKRYPLIYLALTVLVAGVLACNAPTPTTSIPQPPPTVTIYIPPTSPPQGTPSPPPPEASPEATITPTSPEATETPTQTPPPPTPTTPPATPTPTTPVSEGPLDFEKPTWIVNWEPLEDGENRVVVMIRIIGGAPPFTVIHEHEVVGQTWEREYYIEFLRRGCSGIAYEIIVESADGQSVKKGYWIGGDQQPWCHD